jgi:Uncharacterized proteins involved in stress response, homologs of TerZ and putative cAMP-binding protein CABP1
MTDDLFLSKGEFMPARKRFQFQHEGNFFTELVVHLSWDVRTTEGPPFDLDAVVFPITPEGKVPTGRFCVYYNNLVSPDQAVQHEGDDLDGSGGGEVVRIHLNRVSPNVEKLVFAVVIYDAVERHEHFGNVAHTSIKFTAEGHGLLDEHRLAGNFAKFTGVVVGEVHREANHWAFQSIDKGYYGGLSEIGTLYGVHFRDTPPA